MTERLLVLHDAAAGKFSALNARRFRKDVIRCGTWVLPDGRKLRVTPERMDAWVTKFRGMRESGIQITAPVDHDRDSKQNLGFVEDLQREGDRLLAVIDIPKEDDASKIGTTIREVSISVDPSYRDGTGKDWGEVVRHIAPCTEPVVPGQDNFVPLAASAKDKDNVEYVLCRKEQPSMDWKEKIVKLLDLKNAGDMGDEKVFEALETKVSNHGKVLREVKDSRDASIANNQKLQKEVAELRETLKASGQEETDDPKVIELRKEMDAMAREGAEATVSQLEAEGKILPAMKDGVTELLSARNMNLSLKGEEKSVATMVRGVLDGLPKGAALDLSERTKRFQETKNPNDADGKKKTEAELRADGKELANLAQPKVEADK